MLDEIQNVLDEGMRLSRQTSLDRQAPASNAIAVLDKARLQLRKCVEANEKLNPRAWRMLSLAEETLLAYPRAIAALERALALEGHRPQQDLKRLAALREASKR